MIGAADHVTIDVKRKRQRQRETNANATVLASAVKSRRRTTRFCVYGVQLINKDITFGSL